MTEHRSAKRASVTFSEREVEWLDQVCRRMMTDGDLSVLRRDEALRILAPKVQRMLRSVQPDDEGAADT